MAPEMKWAHSSWHELFFLLVLLSQTFVDVLSLSVFNVCFCPDGSGEGQRSSACVVIRTNGPGHRCRVSCHLESRSQMDLVRPVLSLRRFQSKLLSQLGHGFYRQQQLHLITRCSIFYLLFSFRCQSKQWCHVCLDWKLMSADGQTPSPSFIDPIWTEKGTNGTKLRRLTSHPSTCCPARPRPSGV